MIQFCCAARAACRAGFFRRTWLAHDRRGPGDRPVSNASSPYAQARAQCGETGEAALRVRLKIGVSEMTHC